MENPSEKNPVAGDLYGGVADVILSTEPFDFGQGVTIAPTKAHLMRPYLMTFERPDSSFPAMNSARGSFGFDLVAEIHVPADYETEGSFDKANTIWWLAALLRLKATPKLRVPVLSDRSFSNILGSPPSSFWPVDGEADRVRMIIDSDANHTISLEDLEWIKQNWRDAGRLMRQSQEFNVAMQAFDRASFIGYPTLALLSMWAALEAIFSPASAELRYRVSSNIATFLEPPGDNRAAVQQSTVKLYDARSAAIHGRRDEVEKPLIDTYALMKRVLVQIVEGCSVPKLADLEAALIRGN